MEEYYVYDPDKRDLNVYVARDRWFRDITPVDGWVSPRLGVRFHTPPGEELVILRPNGERFLTFIEIGVQAEQERRRADEERQARQQAQGRADQERGRADRLAAQLRAAGIEPEV